jgi:hypothetical protein
VNSHLIAVLLATTACGKSTEECRTEAEAVGKLLMETPHEASAFRLAPDVTLVERGDLKATAAADSIVVVANAREVSFEGTVVSDLADLRVRLAQLRERRRTKPDEIYFQLDRATPWSKVVELVDTARAAHLPIVGFAFATGEKLAPPPRAPIDDQLDRVMNGSDGPANQAVEIAKLMEPVVEDCPALQRVFGAVASDSTESKADLLIKALAPALIECRCKVDIPSLRSLMWRVTATAPIKVVVVEANGGDTLALPGATTWEQAGKQLSHARRYWFTVK